jgi:hypothetical protein
MTDTTVKPFPPFELFVRQLILDKLVDPVTSDPVAPELVGGDLAFDAATQPFYIRLNRFAGSTDRLEGRFIFDLEVFGQDWQETESRAGALEALLLGYPHVVEVGDQKMVFDSVFQNVGVFELPWEDDTVNRLGATYVILARRR